MSQPDIVRGGYIDILCEDPDTLGAYLVLCGFTTNNFVEQVNTSDQFTQDCAVPDDVPVRVLNLTGRQWSLSGEGLHNRAQGALIRSLIGVPTNYRFRMSEPAADNIDDGYYQGQGVIVNRQIGAPKGQYASSQISIESDGEWVWVDA